MGGALFSHCVVWLKILAQRVVSSDPETILDPTGVSLRAGMVNSLSEHGRCRMDSLETGRFLRGAPCSDAIRRTTDSEWNVVLDFLRHAEVGIGFRRDSGFVVHDTRNFAGFLASELYFRNAPATVSPLGVIRCSSELHDLAVE